MARKYSPPDRVETCYLLTRLSHLALWLEDGHSAWLSKNGVVLFEEKILREYIICAIVLKDHTDLMEPYRASRQRPQEPQLPKIPQVLPYRCLTCKRPTVRQSQEVPPPGNHSCAECLAMESLR